MNVLFTSALLLRLLSVWHIIQFRMSIFTLHVILPLVPIQKSCVLYDNCLVHSTSLVSKNYPGSNKYSVDNNFHLLVKVLFTSALLFRLLSVWHIIQFRMSIFTLKVILLLVPIQKSCVLYDNCLVHSTSLVSNNYLGSNNCSVENNFHLLVKVLFPSALLFRHLSVWNIIQLWMLSFTLQVIFLLVPIQKSCALCDNCLVYSTYLVSKNYLGSNKYSVDNNIHLSIECLVYICSYVKTTVCVHIIQFRMSIFRLHVISALVPIQKSWALSDNCLVYSTSLVSKNYLGSNKYSVDNNFHLSIECLVYICSSV